MLFSKDNGKGYSSWRTVKRATQASHSAMPRGCHHSRAQESEACLACRETQEFQETLQSNGRP